MEFDTKTPGYFTSDRSSFAYNSARKRWPIIITGIIEDVGKTINEVSDPAVKTNGTTIIEGLKTLKSEVELDTKLTPLPDDGFNDIAEYNKELEQKAPTWMNVFWLYGECYLYRRINTLFSLSKGWEVYDVFARQKLSTFKSSRPAVLELAARYKEIAENTTKQTPESEKSLFKEMCEICLWGNATDLSLLTSLSYEDIQKLQGSEARKTQEKNILVNNISDAFDTLKAAQSQKDKDIRVDIVLDNAGFELFVDLVFAGYLLSTGLATRIVLHPKSIPWFVSDALPKDFTDILSALSDPGAFYSATVGNGLESKTSLSEEKTTVGFLFNQLNEFNIAESLVVRPDRFWTTCGSYWRLPYLAPTLFNKFKESELVIFKGDLNYRKLTGDAKWKTTTSFLEAIGPLGYGSGVRSLALRTCKADVVGLPSGEDERLCNTPEGGYDTGARRWAWTGKWAVASFCDGRKTPEIAGSEGPFTAAKRFGVH